MYIPSFVLPIYNTACHAKPYLCYLYRKCAIPVPQHCMCVACFFHQRQTTRRRRTRVYCCSWRNDEIKVVFGCSSSPSALLFYCSCCCCCSWWCCFLLYLYTFSFSFSVWWDIPFGIFSFCFSTGAAAAAVGGAASFCTYTLQDILFHFRLMRYTDAWFFSLSGVLFPRE